MEAAHILKTFHCEHEAPEAFEEMRNIRKELLNGADFAELADKHSDSDESGGHLGQFTRGNMAPEFEAITFSMNSGEISPIFQTAYGYHIVKVIDHSEAKEQSREEAADRIKEHLVIEKKNERIENWVEAAEKDAEISIKKD